MEIIKKDIKFCALCNNYTGTVEEKDNGIVPVHCACGLTEEKNKYGKWRSPCMICPNGEKFWWVPTTNYKDSNGKWWHKPYFGGPPLNSIISLKIINNFMGNWNNWQIPSTLEGFQQLVEQQRIENSSISEKKVEEQQGAMRKLEVRFVQNNNRK